MKLINPDEVAQDHHICQTVVRRFDGFYPRDAVLARSLPS